MELTKNNKNKNKKSTLLTYMLFIALDVFVITFLGKIINKEAVVLYTCVRLMILGVQFLIVTFKLLKACFISLRNIVFNEHEMLYDDEYEEGITFNIIKDIIPILIIFVECMILTEAVQYTLRTFRNTLRDSNIEIILVCLILVEVLTCIISIYLNKRQDYIKCN